MRKKFGGYTINAKAYRAPQTRSDGLLQTQTLLEGDIEIGIHIDPNTWRGDWLRDFVFHDEAQRRQARLVNVFNTWLAPEKNLVTAVWDIYPW